MLANCHANEAPLDWTESIEDTALDSQIGILFASKKANILINGSMGFKTLNIYIVVISWFFFLHDSQ